MRANAAPRGGLARGVERVDVEIGGGEDGGDLAAPLAAIAADDDAIVDRRSTKSGRS